MKTVALLLTSLAVTTALQAQTLTKDLPAFDAVVSSPLIDVVLAEGDRESVRIEHQGVDADKINVKVRRKKLHLYLDEARLNTTKRRGSWKSPTSWERLYPGAKLTAYVTYRKLDCIQVRGEQKLVCRNALRGNRIKLELMGENHAEIAGLEAKRLKISLYGENEINVANIGADNLRVSLFGENTVEVQNGTATAQKYRSFGESKVYASNLQGQTIKTNLFGESRLNLNASESLRMTSFGESEVRNSGNGQMRKRLTIGENRLHRE
ncbi:MAG: DUF2807 domain-containing protein [Cytophagales bacterium]|jgi:hypothetical protein|nr:DUF2807 domain-containing protein [Cytophagales bacterium]